MKKQITKLLKMKSITTFVFLGLTIYAVIALVELPEWLVPIITLCFKELFDKDKTNNKKNEEE